MIGISYLTEAVSKKADLSEEQTREVLMAFFETIQQKLNENESINFKGCFLIKRKPEPFKGSKNCTKHQEELEKLSAENKGGGFGIFSEINKVIKHCADCKSKKEEIVKNTKFTDRLTIQPAKELWANKN